MELSTASRLRLSSSSLSLMARSRSLSSAALSSSTACDFLLSSIARFRSSSSLVAVLPGRELEPVFPLRLCTFSSSFPKSFSGTPSTPRIIRSRICALCRRASRNRDSSIKSAVMSFAFCLTFAPWSLPSSSIYWNSFSVLIMYKLSRK